MAGSHGQHSEETKRKIGAVHKGKTISEEHKLKLSQANKGKIIPQETRDKISMAKSGKPCSEELKQILRQIKGEKHHCFGRKLSDETKQHLSVMKSGERHHMFGKHHSEKSKQKMSKTIRGENNPISKLTNEDVIKIKQMLTDGMSYKSIAQQFNVLSATIGSINRNTNWKHIPWPEKKNVDDKNE